MRDELPPKPHKEECGILNLNTSNQDGSHWTAWYKRDNHKLYFDSYGDVKPPKELVNYLGKDNLWYTVKRFQNYNDPPVCGHLCIEFLNKPDSFS